MPEPRPRFEIFVHSPRLEGVHLRGGPIARGGIRWSDRREDFRTEVLGLLKTQMVKNAVIVPVGSKGGFVLKRPPVGRAAFAAEGLACYREFIAALLELTDDYRDEGGAVAPPPDTVRHDGDDPYLVVAADKGTATFSDTANEIALAAGFWLGDAFASGGSDGYDHKGIGITARGAWESVRSHFRVLGLDPAETPFTAVGIGDMSGDVFGNGMLRSRRIRLVAAFSHLHVFIDPDPDPEASFAERERLFGLPGSTWADYGAGLISRGGGVWPRSAKSITLSPEAMAALGVPGAGPSARTPNDVIRAILRAPVDLLWNGGIGTYVKAASQTHAAVGDRSNDSVRINGRELRCRLVGEGGNLGFTQAARIEYAKAGGLVNTDAIDNSGGVDCSDHEVNIKILLDAAVRGGELGAGERSALLHSMTGEVAGQVLRNNYLQNVGLAIARTQAPRLVEVHGRFIERLERTVGLDREGEGLPDRDEIAERRRAGEGLVGPELAVLVAYAKLDLFDALVGSELPEDPEMAAELVAYFPRTLRERFAGAIPRHRLAREIISTIAANETVNRAGITFAFRVLDEIGAAPEDAVRAWFALRRLYRLPELFDDIEGAALSDAAHVAAVLEIRKLTDRGARWILRNAPRPLSVDGVVSRYREGVRAASALIPELASEPIREGVRAAAARLVEAQVPEALAGRLALCSELPSALDIAEVAWRHLGAGGGAGGDARAAALAAAVAAGGGAGGGRRRRRFRPAGARDDGRGRRARGAGVVRGGRAPRPRLASGDDRGPPPRRPVAGPRAGGAPGGPPSPPPGARGPGARRGRRGPPGRGASRVAERERPLPPALERARRKPAGGAARRVPDDGGGAPRAPGGGARRIARGARSPRDRGHPCPRPALISAPSPACRGLEARAPRKRVPRRRAPGKRDCELGTPRAWSTAPGSAWHPG